MHELTERIPEQVYFGGKMSWKKVIDKIIREWLEEKAISIDGRLHPNQPAGITRQILGLSEKTLEEKIKDYLLSQPHLTRSIERESKSIVKIAEEHLEQKR